MINLGTTKQLRRSVTLIFLAINNPLDEKGKEKIKKKKKKERGEEEKRRGREGEGKRGETEKVDAQIKLTMSLKFFVLEWQTVTVACSHLSSSETGVPTMRLRPRTTTFFPAIGMPVRLMSSTQPAGVQGTKPLKSFTAMRPSFTVFRLEKSLIKYLLKT